MHAINCIHHGNVRSATPSPAGVRLEASPRNWTTSAVNVLRFGLVLMVWAAHDSTWSQPPPAAYVANANDDTVSVVSLESLAVVKTITVGDVPTFVAASSDGTHVYVVNRDSNSVSVIDTVSGSVSATVVVGRVPAGLAVSRDGRQVYVANSDSASVSVIDTVSNTVAATVSTGPTPYGIAVHPLRDEVWIGYGQLGTVLDARSTADYSVLASLTSFSRMYAAAMAFRPDGSELLAAEDCGFCGRFHLLSGQHTAGAITVLQPDILYDDTGSATALAINPVSGVAYLGKAGQNGVPYVREFGGAGRSLTLSASPRGMSVAPDGQRLYVVITGGVPLLGVVDTATFGLTATVEVGANPQGLALASFEPRPSGGLQLLGTAFLGGSEQEFGYGISVHDGGIYAVGRSTANGNDGLLARFARPLANGVTPVWSTLWPGLGEADVFNGVAASEDGVFAVGGSSSRTTDLFGDKETKGIAARFPLDGVTGGGHGGAIWDKQVPPTPGQFSYGGSESLAQVALSSEDGAPYLYATGTAEADWGQGRTWIAKLAADGTAVWTADDAAEAVARRHSEGWALAVDAGGVYVAGTTEDPGVFRPYLRKYAANGDLVWKRNSDNGLVFTAVHSAAGAVYAVGSTARSGASADFLVEKWDEGGTRLWSRVYDRNSAEDVLRGVVGLGNRLFAVGSTRGGTAEGSDLIILELDPATGDVVGSTLYGGVADDTANGVATDGTDLYVVGDTQSYGAGGSDLLLLRYALSAEPPAAPTIITRPADQTVPAGGIAQFTVAAGGTEPLSYQWRKGDTDLVDTGNITGATTPTLTITNVRTSDAGDYGVVVSNARGTAASGPVELEVLQPGYLYWSTIATTGPTTSNSHVKRANLDGSAIQTVLSTSARGRFGGIAFNPGAGHLYTGDGQNLYRANLDGTGRQTVVSGTTVTDVELDLLHGKVYWAGYDPDAIYRANLDGSSVEEIVSLAFVDLVEGLALDPVAGRLYVAFNSQATSQIRSYGLDGSNLSVLKMLDSGAAPFDVELNLPGAELYWNPQGQRCIQRTRQDGSGPIETVFTPTAGLGNGMHFDSLDRQIYFAATVPGPVDIHRVSAAGTGEIPLVHDPDSVNYIEVLHLALAPPTIVAQPQSRAVALGGSVSLDVIAGGPLPLSYRWRKGAVELSDGGRVSGAATATLSISNVQPEDAGAYTVRVSNAFGAVESAVAMVTVLVPPSITQQPQSRTIPSGRRATLSAAAAGTEPLTFQWYVGQSGDTANLIPGATTANHITQPLTATTAFWMRVTNTLGSVDSETATVTVIDPPSFATQPRSLSVPPGGIAGFVVEAAGTGPFEYQWRLNGQNLVGATNAGYTILEVQLGHAGTYTVVVSNAGGSQESDRAALTLSGVPLLELVDHFADRRVFREPGGQGTSDNAQATRELAEPRHAGKTGGRSLWMTWEAAGDGIATFSTSGSGFDTLLAVYVGTELVGLQDGVVASDEDSGGYLTSRLSFNARRGLQYQVAVDGYAGAAGIVVLTWDLTVTQELQPDIIRQPVGGVVQEDAAFAMAVASDQPQATYQWSRNGQALAGQTQPTLVIERIVPSDAGTYRARVTGPNGRFLDSTEAALEVVPGTAAPLALGELSADKWQDLFRDDLVEVDQPIRPQGQPSLMAYTSISLGLGGRHLHLGSSTRSPDDPETCGTVTGASRWFRFRVDKPRPVELRLTSTEIDAVLAAYGNPGWGWVPVMDCLRSEAKGKTVTNQFGGLVGQDYLVMVAGVGDQKGEVSVEWQGVEPEPIPCGLAAETRSGRLRIKWCPEGLGVHILEWSQDLDTWHYILRTFLNGEGFEYHDTEPMEAGTHKFFRLRPELPPLGPR